MIPVLTVLFLFLYSVHGMRVLTEYVDRPGVPERDFPMIFLLWPWYLWRDRET